MRLPTLVGIAASAIIALAAWPSFASHRWSAPAATLTPAPVMRDYLLRDRFVTFYEHEVRLDRQDQISQRMLAQQYMQRFREQFDMADVERARHLALRSIQLQPQGNTAAQMTLASTYLAYHDFDRALDHERDALAGEPYNVNARAQIASLLMEEGRYGEARTQLDAIHVATGDDPTVDSIWARYDELNGQLSQARALIARAIRTVDEGVDIPAYDRSWFHMRAAQLAYEAGDTTSADAEFTTSLADFPNNAVALMWRAKMERGQRRWSDALADATRSAELYPLPQTLGYEADAQRALGQRAAAARTDALIGVEQRLFNVQGINDRLLALYYAGRGINLNEALRAARSDYAKRGDEVYADDTLAWVYARRGSWNDARRFAVRALRLHTLDAGLDYHAGIIALHTGHGSEARGLLTAALALNGSFDPFEADDARTQLTSLQKVQQ